MYSLMLACSVIVLGVHYVLAASPQLSPAPVHKRYGTGLLYRLGKPPRRHYSYGKRAPAAHHDWQLGGDTWQPDAVVPSKQYWSDEQEPETGNKHWGDAAAAMMQYYGDMAGAEPQENIYEPTELTEPAKHDKLSVSKRYGLGFLYYLNRVQGRRGKKFSKG